MDLGLNNLQRLIRHKTQLTKPNQKYVLSGRNYLYFNVIEYHIKIEKRTKLN